tara:strand:- start:1797 stop:2828 length:1032 start_codon:yes stop_codon:yes gene_type:complete
MSKVIQLKKKNNDFSTSVDKLLKLSKKEIDDINILILKKLDSKIPLIKEIANHIILSGGKRLRPLLTVTCSKLVGYGFKKNETNHIGLAAAVEFIHTATLMHDDVVDESKMRRGKLSSNEIWGNKTSVLVGDFLFSKAFDLISNQESSEILKLLSDTSIEISEGEILELLNDKDPTINEDTYFKVINGKTASLFSAATQVGGMAANISKSKQEGLKAFGTNFGIAFQLIDDALDYSSSAKKLGKNVGDDFKEGKITLPIILAYLRSNTEEKKFWKRTIKNLNQKKEDLRRGIELINKYNCIEDTMKRASHFLDIAEDSLGLFENNEFKIALLELIENSQKRIN